SRSGPKRDKKGALELENCLKALREGDTLVVWALDRLGGSLGQVITLLDDLKKRGITFIAIKDRIDTNAPVIGEIYTHLMAIFSSFERNRNIERTRSGLAAARARGRVGGRKPSLSEEDVKQITHIMRLLISLWDVGTVFFTIYPQVFRHEKSSIYYKYIEPLSYCFSISFKILIITVYGFMKWYICKCLFCKVYLLDLSYNRNAKPMTGSNELRFNLTQIRG
ncbi:TPA: recombinase family protein, partial [Klebsiella pneumoniae]